jgi:hypothetical protein
MNTRVRSILGCALAATVLVLLLAGPGAAAPSTTGLVPQIDSESAGRFPDLDCYHEDSWHLRMWSGSLSPGQSFSVVLPFCTDPPSPGGAVLRLTASSQGSLAVYAVSPSGEVYDAHLQPATSKKPSLQVRAGCVLSPTYLSSVIEPGTWTVVIQNTGTRTVKDISFIVEVNMTFQSWQMSVCPPEDWNF